MKIFQFFLGFLVISAISAQALAQDFPQGQKRKQNYQIGLQLYTVRDACAKDFEGTIREVAKIGFSGVEFAGYYGRSAESLRKLLDENNLKCYGTHIQLSDLLGDNYDKTVAFNKVLGNKFLAVASLPSDRLATREAILRTAEIFNGIAAKLKPHGMVIGFHNHAHEFQKVEGELIFDTFFSHTSSAVAIQFDTGNSQSAGYQAGDFLEKYPGRVRSTHVKDFSSTRNDALLGDGEVNWEPIIKFYQGARRPTWYIIEQETYPFPSLVCAERCLRTFEKMMGIKR